MAKIKDTLEKTAEKVVVAAREKVKEVLIAAQLNEEKSAKLMLKKLRPLPKKLLRKWRKLLQPREKSRKNLQR